MPAAAASDSNRCRVNRRFFLVGSAVAVAVGSSAASPLPKRTSLPWNALAKRLRGRLVLPGQSGFGTLALPNNLRYAARKPAGIALCETAADVSAALLWARENDVALIARSGGHSYAGYSTTTGLMIDVSRMNSFHFDTSSGVLTLGGGARNQTVFDGCRPLGVAIPHGRCFQVGLAGLGLGGGIGFNLRPNGLTSDAMLQTQIVTADGELHTVDASSNPDLFWACRGGGGGNFGINTSFSFQTFPVDKVAACALWWYDDLERIFEVLVAALENGPDTLGSKVSVELGRDPTTGKGTAAIQLLAQLNGRAPQLLDILRPVYAVRSPGKTLFFDYAPYWVVQEKLSEPGPPSYYQERSRFFNQRFSEEAVAAVLSWCRRWPGTTRSAEFKIFQTGGAVNTLSPGATAFVHRNSWWLGSINVTWSGTTPPSDLQRALEWQAAFYETLVPIAKGGAYQNFIDPSLKDWKTAYYGANLPRLEAVKRRVDPENVFTFPEAIR
jgi:hypothetical protein